MLECVTPSLQREPTWEVDTFGDQEKAIIVELFAQCDADGSGVLEMSEIDQLLTKITGADREQVAAMKQSILAKYDKNHDSALSLDEFIAMIAHIKALSMKHASLDAAESALGGMDARALVARERELEARERDLEARVRAWQEEQDERLDLRGRSMELRKLLRQIGVLMLVASIVCAIVALVAIGAQLHRRVWQLLLMSATLLCCCGIVQIGGTYSYGGGPNANWYGQ